MTNAAYAVGDELDDKEPLNPPAVRLLDGKTGKELIKLDLGKSDAAAVAWSADGQSLLAAFDAKVVRFDVATGKRLTEVELPHFRQDPATKLLLTRDIGRAAFLGHGAEIVTSGQTEIFGWRLPGGEKRWTMPREDGNLGLPFIASRDERILAISSTSQDRSGKVRLYDLGTRRLLTTLDLGRDWAECASFSPDNNRLLVGLSDGTALIYDVSEIK